MQYVSVQHTCNVCVRYTTHCYILPEGGSGCLVLQHRVYLLPIDVKIPRHPVEQEVEDRHRMILVVGKYCLVSEEGGTTVEKAFINVYC